jgi:ankyrin repeat protein
MHCCFAFDVHRYKADIEATDTHQRTPLFIACAMNREQCADYLIQCLDHSVHVAPTPAQISSNAGNVLMLRCIAAQLFCLLCFMSSIFVSTLL